MTLADYITNQLEGKTVVSFNGNPVNKVIGTFSGSVWYDGQCSIGFTDGSDLDIYADIETIVIED
jgi:hypothetical protein